MDGSWIYLLNPLSKIVSDTLTFLDDTGLSMAASDNPGDISDSEDDEKDS